MDKQQIQKQLNGILQDIEKEYLFQKGDIFVLGCSTSEIQGGQIGKASNQEIGQWVVETCLHFLKPKGIYLAVQGCEHINRTLVVEKKLAEKKELDIVSVFPALHAGGACSVAAFKQFEHPVEVEHIVAQVGIDIGDTAIGMHIKHVQVPIRPTQKELGKAHVTALKTRPKYIGGKRATYL